MATLSLITQQMTGNYTEVADINQSFEESELCLAHQFEWNCKMDGW